jgi:hypothetical protein
VHPSGTLVKSCGSQSRGTLCPPPADAGKPGPFCPGSSRFAIGLASRPGSGDYAILSLSESLSPVRYGLNHLAADSSPAFVTRHITLELMLVTVTARVWNYITRAMLSSSRWKASNVLPNKPTLLTAVRASSGETP